MAPRKLCLDTEIPLSKGQSGLQSDARKECPSALLASADNKPEVAIGERPLSLGGQLSESAVVPPASTGRAIQQIRAARVQTGHCSTAPVRLRSHHSPNPALEEFRVDSG